MNEVEPRVPELSCCPAIPYPPLMPLLLYQKSKQASFVPMSKSECAGVEMYPVEQSNEDGPNFAELVLVVALVGVHVCADPPAFTSVNVEPPLLPSMCSRIFVKASLPGVPLLEISPSPK